MILLSHEGRELELPPDSMIIINNASERDYEFFANEDLKIEFDGACLYIHSPASKRHEDVVFNLLNIFKTFLKQNPSFGNAIGSRFALRLPNGKRPEPDVVIVPANSVNETDSVYDDVPKMVIEILSPGTADHDMTVKRQWYEESKIPEIWYVDLDARKIIVIRLAENHAYLEEEHDSGSIRCDALGGLEISIDDVFST
ncbi:MAG TPA: Uma2 family endonuclease [Candidatus Lokiarchaeia archaeon]|nr:Uma2 family endonuclease [Candidatus Lokiarchaeia archaeon]